MLKKTLLASVCCCFISLNSFAQTLPEALELAYKTNPILKSSRNTLKSADENVAIAKSGYRPTVNITGSVGYESLDSNLYETESGAKDNIGLSATQPLFSGLSTYNSVKASKYELKASQNNFYSTEQSFLLTASSTYLSLLKSQAVLKLQKNNEDLLKQKLDETKKRFEIGDVTTTDLSQAKASYAEAVAETISAKGDVEAVNAEYERIVGEKPSELSEPSFIKALTPNSIDDALLFTKNNNYYIKQAKNTYVSNAYNVAKDAGALLPSVDLKASASHSTSNSSTSFDGDLRSDSMEVALNLTMPIYDAGLNRATLRQSKYKKAAAADDVVTATRQAISDTTSAFEVMIASKAQLSSIDAQIEANKLALDGTQKEEKLGNRTLLNVLDAYQDLLNSEVSKEIAKEKYYNSALELLLSMGKLTASDLKLNVNIYNPTKTYKETKGKWLSTSINKEN